MSATPQVASRINDTVGAATNTWRTGWAASCTRVSGQRRKRREMERLQVMQEQQQPERNDTPGSP